jgi:hypothetical protein
MSTPLSSAQSDSPAASDRPLTKPLLVGSTIGNKALILVVSGTSVVVLALLPWVLIDPSDAAGFTPIFAAAVLFALAVGFGVMWELRRRRWVEVTLTGFVLSSRKKKTLLADEQVGAVSQQCNYEPRVIRYDVRLEIEHQGAIERIRFTHRYKHGQVNPLEAFLERVVRGLARRTRENLERGAALSGKGWRLDARGLHCSRAGKSETYALSDLPQAGQYGEYLCVWRGGEERPFLRIPMKSRNAYPLAWLLHDVIAAREVQGPRVPGLPLQRLLYEVSNPDMRAGMLLIGMALIPGVLFGWAWWLSPDDLKVPLIPWSGMVLNWTARVLALFGLPLVLLGISVMIQSRKCRVLFHEEGIAQPTEAGQRELLYTEIGTMVWKAGREMIFQPLPGIDRPEIHYRSLCGYEDTDLIGIRDWIASFMAACWLVKMQHQPVTWTPTMRFLADGLEYQPTDLPGGSKLVTVPYRATSYRIENETFLLFVQGQTEPVVKESLEAANFFPGLSLLNQLCGRSTEAATRDSRWTPAPTQQEARITSPERQTGVVTPEGTGEPDQRLTESAGG